MWVHGVGDKAPVRPKEAGPRRLPRGCWPGAARAPSPEPSVAPASVLARPLLPGRAHRGGVPCRHPSSPRPSAAGLAASGQPALTLALTTPAPHGPAAPLAAPLALPLAAPVRGLGVRLGMRAGHAYC